jgi:hypothetical protein
MRQTKCLSVRVKSLEYLTAKCCKIISHNGTEALIPASCVFGRDASVKKSEAYWIAEWILKNKNIQHSSRKVGYFHEKYGILPEISIKKHVPQKIKATEVSIISELVKCS